MGKGFKVGLGFAGELSRNLIHTWLEQAKAQGRVWVRLTWAFYIQVEKVVKKGKEGMGLVVIALSLCISLVILLKLV